jgi:hypothetical protein
MLGLILTPMSHVRVSEDLLTKSVSGINEVIQKTRIGDLKISSEDFFSVTLPVENAVPDDCPSYHGISLVVLVIKELTQDSGSAIKLTKNVSELIRRENRILGPWKRCTSFSFQIDVMAFLHSSKEVPPSTGPDIKFILAHDLPLVVESQEP